MIRPDNIAARVLLYELEAAFLFCHYLAEQTNEGERPPRSTEDLLGRHAGRALAKAAAKPLAQREATIAYFLRELPPELQTAARLEVAEGLVFVDQSAIAEDRGLTREVLYEVDDRTIGWSYKAQPDLSGWQGHRFVLVEEKRSRRCQHKYWGQLYFAAFVWAYGYWLEQKRLFPEREPVLPRISLRLRCTRGRNGRRFWDYSREFNGDIFSILQQKRSVCRQIDRCRLDRYFRPRMSATSCQGCDRRDGCAKLNGPGGVIVLAQVLQIDARLSAERAQRISSATAVEAGKAGNGVGLDPEAKPDEEMKPVA
jgi:hypothetical protein